jgi:Domain of unknown function (DUF4760)
MAGDQGRAGVNELIQQTLEVWNQSVTLAPIVTAIIAFVAVVVALLSILIQRNIARRRAAIDFFLKAEMDRSMIELSDHFREAVPKIRAAVSIPEFIATNRDDYKKIRSFLNVCELIAVGINYNIFSEKVALAYWGDVLPRSFEAAAPLIKYIRTTPDLGTPATYRDLEKLCRKWI